MRACLCARVCARACFISQRVYAPRGWSPLVPPQLPTRLPQLRCPRSSRLPQCRAPKAPTVACAATAVDKSPALCRTVAVPTKARHCFVPKSSLSQSKKVRIRQRTVACAATAVEAISGWLFLPKFPVTIGILSREIHLTSLSSKVVSPFSWALSGSSIIPIRNSGFLCLSTE